MSLSERIHPAFERDIVYTLCISARLCSAITKPTFRQFSDISPVSPARALPELLRNGREGVLEVAACLGQAARHSAEVYLLETLCSLGQGALQRGREILPRCHLVFVVLVRASCIT